MCAQQATCLLCKEQSALCCVLCTVYHVLCPVYCVLYTVCCVLSVFFPLLPVFRQYLRLRAAQLQSAAAQYLYEGTVGAGLPIISTLQGLLNTGDKIRRIEGIFR